MINDLEDIKDSKLTNQSYVRLLAKDIELCPQLDNLPLMVYGIDSKKDAAKVQEYLLQFYHPNIPIEFYCQTNKKEILLSRLDSQQSYGKSCKIFLLPSKEFDKNKYTFGDLCRIMYKLTAEGGCLWDINQTHESIRSNMIEEAYEAVNAIDACDKDNLIEELGDVMLQSIFHADIARRSGEFELGDVINRLSVKLVSRHTHVFAGSVADSQAKALRNWEDAKKAEQGSKAVDYIGFPALLRAQKIIKKLKKEDQLKDSDAFNTTEKKYFGKLLFDCVHACYLQGIDAEIELNKYLNTLVKDNI